EFRELGDLERLLGRFASARILSPRDFLVLKFTLWHLPEIKQILEQLPTAEPHILRSIATELDTLGALAEELDREINPEPPVTVAHLGVIRDGANIELDELRALTRSSRERLMEIQTRER